MLLLALFDAYANLAAESTATERGPTPAGKGEPGTGVRLPPGSMRYCFDALASALLEASALPALGNPESPRAIADLATEFREHSESVAFRVRDALDYVAREWKTRHSYYLEERERQLQASGRVIEADLARQYREQPVPKNSPSS